MAQQKPTNPFYAVLVPVGIIFVVTVCSYTMMAYRGRDPHSSLEGGLVGLMTRHGLAIVVAELIVLGILTLGAIFTDEFWTRRSAARQEGVQDKGRQ